MNQHVGWESSAQAWIDSNGDEGDRSRRYVLDPAVLRRLKTRAFKTALDVGCGEGRFCRVMQSLGIKTVGIDPTKALLGVARERDPDGDYRCESAENLSFSDASFELVISYLSLIDIPDFRAAIAEMARVLKPGGLLLVINLTDFQTAGMSKGWRLSWRGALKEFAIDNYSIEKPVLVEWSGIKVENWHRPLDAYMQTYLGAGLRLNHYEHPMPSDEDAQLSAKYRRVPWFNLMEWAKPETAGDML
ncbi:MAG: class I SAM-dependent methyltransferase [Pseudomonadota bacterium]